MHPLVAEQSARLVVEDRLQTAAVRRRVGAARSQPRLRSRLGDLLVALGGRMQPAGARRTTPTAAAHSATARTAGC